MCDGVVIVYDDRSVIYSLKAHKDMHCIAK